MQYYRKASLFLTTMLCSLLIFAQEKKLDVDIDINKKDEWYRQPWVWVIGAAVFVLLLVAILKSGSKK